LLLGCGLCRATSLATISLLLLLLAITITLLALILLELARWSVASYIVVTLEARLAAVTGLERRLLLALDRGSSRV
jgi:hypothetical protein